MILNNIYYIRSHCEYIHTPLIPDQPDPLTTTDAKGRIKGLQVCFKNDMVSLLRSTSDM